MGKTNGCIAWGGGWTSVDSRRHQERRLSTGIAILVSHAYRNRTGALQYDETRDSEEKVGVQLAADSGTEVTLTLLTATFTKTHLVSQYRPTSTYRYKKKKGKVHPCTGTEALYRPYDP